MGADMTGRAKRIAEIEARANAATEGPWDAEGTAEGAWIRGPNGHWAALACGESEQEAIANREFLKHARADIPWLLAELRAAQAENNTLRNRAVNHENDMETIRAKLATARETLSEIKAKARMERAPQPVVTTYNVIERRAAAVLAELDAMLAELDQP